MSRNTFKKDLLLIEEKNKKHYAIIIDYRTFMYDHTLHREKNHFCRYCLQAFSTEEILKSHINDCSKINSKQVILMPKEDKYVKSKNYEKE